MFIMKRYQKVTKPDYYLIGFTDTGYLRYDPETHKTHACCSVKVDEQIQHTHDFPNLKKIASIVHPV